MFTSVAEIANAVVAQSAKVDPISLKNTLILPSWAAGVLSFLLFMIVGIVVYVWKRHEQRVDIIERCFNDLKLAVTSLKADFQRKEVCKQHLDRIEGLITRADEKLEGRVRDVERTIDRCPNCTQSKQS